MVNVKEYTTNLETRKRNSLQENACFYCIHFDKVKKNLVIKQVKKCQLFYNTHYDTHTHTQTITKQNVPNAMQFQRNVKHFTFIALKSICTCFKVEEMKNKSKEIIMRLFSYFFSRWTIKSGGKSFNLHFPYLHWWFIWFQSGICEPASSKYNSIIEWI